MVLWISVARGHFLAISSGSSARQSGSSFYSNYIAAGNKYVAGWASGADCISVSSNSMHGQVAVGGIGVSSISQWASVSVIVHIVNIWS